MGIDQWNNTYHDLGKYPRKALLMKLGTNKAKKIYVDKKDGTTAHVGYVDFGLHYLEYNPGKS